MLYSIAGVISLLALFFLMIVMIASGQRVGKSIKKKPGLDITEGALFTLMALLVTFTFSSASQRYDLRRIAIINETNAISTAYLRLDILKVADKKNLQRDFIDYISSRIAIYQAVPDFTAVEHEKQRARVAQQKLWSDAIAAVGHSSTLTAPMLILPSLNTAFDIASERTAYSMLHPHAFIFGLMLIVVLVSSFLTGYGIVDRGAWGSLHVILFAIITALTISIIIDLEYPRLGFVQETEFDTLLINLKNQMEISAT